MKDLNILGRINDIISSDKQKYHIDTVLINRVILEEEGLLKDNIFESGICTKCRSDKLHSYRADGDNSGRNTGLMCIK